MTRRYVIFMFVILFLSCCKNRGVIVIPPSSDSIAKELLKNNRDLDTIMLLYHRSFEKNNKVAMMVLSREIGRSFRDISDFSNAIKYHSIELDLATELKDTVELVRSYNNLGADFRRLGAFAEAMNYHNNALELVALYSDTTSFEANKNKTVTFNGIGNISLTLGYLEDANRFFKESLKIEKKLGSHVGQAINYANLGSVYQKKNMLDSAMWYYQKSMDENQQANSNIGISLCYGNFGHIYETQNKLKEADDAYQKSFVAIENEKDLWHKMVAYISLGRINIKRNNPQKAFYFLNQALVVSNKMEASEFLVEIYELMYQYYKAQGNSSKALFYFEKNRFYANKINNEQDNNRFMETRVTYERERNKREEALLLYKNERERMRNNYIILATFIIIAFLIVVVILMNRLKRGQKKRADILDNMNNIKNKFFSIIAHDLKNPAIEINNILKHLCENASTMQYSDIKLFCSELYSASNSQVELLDALLNWAKVEMERMEYNPVACDIKTIVSGIEQQLNSSLKKKNISLTKNYSATTTIVEADINMLSVVIRNLLSNAIKFSHIDTSIDISVLETEDSDILISINDHGVGMSSQDIEKCFRLDQSLSQKGTCGETGTGLGLLVCREMLNRHKSTLCVESKLNHGSVFSFILKKALKDN